MLTHIFVSKYLRMEARRDVFQAIADPTRREIIALIAKESMNVNTVSDHFDMSRPAISQHMKILVECGLVLIKKNGRERICEASLQPLQEVSLWADTYRQTWEQRFDLLEKWIAEDEKPVKRTKKKHQHHSHKKRKS